MPFYILGVGIATLDIINCVNHYPNEDEELRADSQHVSRGGNTANSLTVLSQFNHQCYWMGSLADDSNAALITKDFTKNKINFSLCKKIPDSKHPTSYITLNTQNGSRTIVHYRDLPELNFLQFKKTDLKKFHWIHFEARAISETVKMIKLVKAQHPKIKISIEIEKSRDQLDSIYDLADLYLFSRAFAKESGFNEAKSFLIQQKQYSPDSDLVCSWGEQGAYAFLTNNRFLSSQAIPPKKIVDTIGAGDTFNAALIHSRLSENNWQASLDFACKIAGKKCGQLGFEDLAVDIDML